MAKVDISQVPLNIPEAYLAADLYGIKNDLQWILSACEKVKSMSAFRASSIELEAFVIAIISKYGRCNKDGVRKRIPKKICEGLSLQNKKTHDFLLSFWCVRIGHIVRESEKGSRLERSVLQFRTVTFICRRDGLATISA